MYQSVKAKIARLLHLVVEPLTIEQLALESRTSLAGFQVSTTGRFWVSTEGGPKLGSRSRHPRVIVEQRQTGILRLREAALGVDRS